MINTYIYIYIHKYIYLHNIHKYIYIHRERERERFTFSKDFCVVESEFYKPIQQVINYHAFQLPFNFNFFLLLYYIFSVTYTYLDCLLGVKMRGHKIGKYETDC